MNKILKKVAILLALVIVFSSALLLTNVKATGADTTTKTEQAAEASTVDNSKSAKAIGASLGVGLGALGAAIGMGLAIAKAADGISRQPEAESKIRTTLMLGLVFIETVVIYALIVAILVIFVL